MKELTLIKALPYDGHDRPFLCDQRVITLSIKVPESSQRVWSIPPLLFKVGITKSIGGCILGCKVLCTIFGVTLALTSCLSRPRIIVSVSYLSKFLFWMHYGVADCRVQ